MSKFHAMPIRVQLFLMAFIVALPAAGIVIHSGLKQREEAIKTARTESQKLADDIASEQQNLVTNAQQLANTLAHLPDIRSHNILKAEGVLGDILRINPQYLNIFIVDRNGIMWASAIPSRASHALSVADRRHFINARATGRFSSGECIIGRMLGKPTISFGYPFHDQQGAFSGVIVINFDLSYCSRLLERSKLPPGSSYLLLDHKGVILSKGINPAQSIGKKAPEGLLKQLQEGPERDTFVGTGIDGSKRFLSYRKLRISGEQAPYMYVRAGIPVETVLDDVNSALFLDLGFFGVFMALVVYLAWLIGKYSIVDRITQLENASKSLADGKLDIRVSDLVVGGELGSLGQTFDNMAHQLALREKALLDSESNYREIFNAVKDAIFLHDAESGKIVAVNKTVEEMFGYSCEEILLVTVQEISSGEPPFTLADAIQWIRKTCKEGPQSFEWLCKRKNGECFWAEVLMSDTRIGGEGRVLAVVRDIDERKKAEEEQQKLASLVENSTDFIGIATLAGEFFYINRAGQKMLGMEAPTGTEVARMTDRFSAEDRQNFSELLTAILERGNWTGEFRFRNQKTGVSIPVDLNGFLITNRKTGEPLALATVSRDITERKRYEAQLLYQATYDILTGLPNRNLLNDRFTQAIAVENRHQSCLCLMLMDLDNFKIVNDTLGHAVGDVLLQYVACRIQAVVRKSDTVARLGGDEFVVVPVNISSGQEAAKVAEQILSTLSQPFTINGREIFLTVSIGIAIYPHDGDSLDHLLKHADVAMYHAKSLGKNNYQFFTAEINDRIHERLAMETLLRRALERDEYLLHYQPLVDLKSGRVVGVEALLRWQPEGEGLFLPDRFIPLLEETGLIIPVGEWVLRTACRQLHEWCQAGHDLRLSVNISARQFHSGTITERIIDIVRGSGCTPGQICLELTESIIMQDSDEIIHKLGLLRKSGFSLSIDDFGTGFSSLSYLKRLPISELKIDRTFISGLPANSSDTAIVNSIIHMAGCLQMNVVAEGAETEEQVRFLTENGCSRAQGHYFSRPLSPGEFAVSLQRAEEDLISAARLSSAPS